MRKYDSSLGQSILAPILVAVIIVAGFAAAMFWFPGGIGPTTTTTTDTTTTTTTTGGGGGYGPLAAEYLNSRREDVNFFWIYNCTLVNVDLSSYYDAQQPDAFVDGVFMWRNDTDFCRIEVFFHPYSAGINGSGEIIPDQWFALSGSLIDNGLGRMSDATSYPAEFPDTWPIELYMMIFFDDNSVFNIGYTSSDGLVYIQNGTWSGEWDDMGVPLTSNWQPGYWLNEGGYLTTPINDFYTTIAGAVDYP
ncbi:MAG: hypothetical protein ACFFAX_12805 [Promethearchaeota archaeon]